MDLNYVKTGLILLIIIIIIGYFIYTNIKPPPSSTACSPSNLTGICEAADQVCSKTGTCVDGNLYPCSPSDLYGYCPPNTSTICDNITGSSTLGTCISNKPCGNPPHGSITGYCDSNKTCNTQGICVTKLPCGNPPAGSNTGSCTDQTELCVSGVCVSSLPCGPGTEKPVTTSQSGTCNTIPGQSCQNGVCLTICGTGYCELGMQCLNSTCIEPTPKSLCLHDYTTGSSDPYTCDVNYPSCNGVNTSASYGVCGSSTDISTQACFNTSDCNNIYYPNGTCSTDNTGVLGRCLYACPAGAYESTCSDAFTTSCFTTKNQLYPINGSPINCCYSGDLTRTDDCYCTFDAAFNSANWCGCNGGC